MLLFYLAVELAVGTWGLILLTRERSDANSTDDGGKKLTLDTGKAGRRLFGRFAIGGDHYRRALSPNNSRATRIISIWS